MTHKNFPSNTYKGYLIQFFIVYNWLQPNLFSLAFLFQERNVCIFHVLFIPTWQGEMILNPKFTETRMEKTLWKIVHEKANNLNNQIAREKRPPSFLALIVSRLNRFAICNPVQLHHPFVF